MGTSQTVAHFRNRCWRKFLFIFLRSLGALPQTLVCPRLSTACPDLFCPFNCAGRGICNYDTIVNGTIRPTCECFDKSDISPGCSDSLLQKGDFFDDAGGLLDDIEEDFFDPLVAVFVDHPDKWTSASWAWGAGLLTIFLVMLLCVCSTFWPESDSKNKELTRSYRRDASPRVVSSPGKISTKKTSSSARHSQDYYRRTASTRSRNYSKERRPLHVTSPVVSPTQYHQSQVYGNRTSSSTLAEL